MIGLVFASSLASLILEAAEADLSSAISTRPASLIMAIVSFAFGCCLCGLGGYHCYLITQDKTTKQAITMNRERRAQGAAGQTDSLTRQGVGVALAADNAQEADLEATSAALHSRERAERAEQSHAKHRQALSARRAAAHDTTRHNAGKCYNFYKLMKTPVPASLFDLQGEVHVDRFGTVQGPVQRV
jgi:hypothetical protein